MLEDIGKFSPGKGHGLKAGVKGAVWLLLNHLKRGQRGRRVGGRWLRFDGKKPGEVSQRDGGMTSDVF